MKSSKRREFGRKYEAELGAALRNIQISGGYSVARSQSVWKARCFLVFYVQGVENDRRKSFTKRVIFTPVDITIYTEGRNVLVSACIKWIVAKSWFSSQNLAKKWISLFFQPEMKSCCSYWWLSFFYRLKAKVVSAAQEGCYLCFHYWLEVIVERRWIC